MKTLLLFILSFSALAEYPTYHPPAVVVPIIQPVQPVQTIVPVPPPTPIYIAPYIGYGMGR